MTEVNTDYHLRGSLGMVNMKERAELVEGRLNLTSQEGKGTTISVLVPIKEQPTESTHHTRPITQLDNPLKISVDPPSNPNKEKSNIPFATKRSPSS
jgi:hypothetical protein